MSIPKKGNYQFNGGSPNLPFDVGDRFYAQDQSRDFNFLQDKIGLILKDIIQQNKVIVLGGVVSAGGTPATQISITDFVGYTKFNVTIPDSPFAFPPPVTTADIDFMRIHMTALTNINVVSYGATLSGGTPTNYIKVKYNEVNLNSRARAKAAGTYYYEVSPSYTLTIDTTAPTDYEICLGTIAGNGSGNLTITTNGRPLLISDYIHESRSQEFLTSDTFIVPHNVNRLWVTIIGGGGGGAAGGSTLVGGGGGGGAGETYYRKLINVTPLENISVTIGNGGIGGQSIGNNGSNGTSSSFGAYLTALYGKKGNIGVGVGVGGNGGNGGGGTLGGNGGGNNSDPTNGNDGIFLSQEYIDGGGGGGGTGYQNNASKGIGGNCGKNSGGSITVALYCGGGGGAGFRGNGGNGAGSSAGSASENSGGGGGGGKGNNGCIGGNGGSGYCLVEW